MSLPCLCFWGVGERSLRGGRKRKDLKMVLPILSQHFPLPIWWFCLHGGEGRVLSASFKPMRTFQNEYACMRTDLQAHPSCYGEVTCSSCSGSFLMCHQSRLGATPTKTTQRQIFVLNHRRHPWAGIFLTGSHNYLIYHSSSSFNRYLLRIYLQYPR